MAFRKVNEFKEMTLVYSSNGAVSVQFYTDIPTDPGTGAPAARLGSGVALAAGSTMGVRLTQTIPLDGIRGTKFYPKITPGATTQFELYSGVVYLRPIGVFVDGSTVPQGEVWQPAPIAPGV
jgi:hypothetical protein